MKANINQAGLGKVVILLSCAALASPHPVFGQGGQLDATAQANIYGAGHASAPGPAGRGGGILPPSFLLRGGDILTFQVTGQVSYNGGGNYYGADGYVGAATQMGSLGGISGIQHTSRAMFLAGVFLTDQEPAGAPPPMLDFTSGDFADLSPLVNQLFFIGDGLTGTGTGTVQGFHAPDGTTRLFLGFADGSNFTGLPGSYLDNVGSLHVAYTLTPRVLGPKFQVERSRLSLSQGFRFNLLSDLNSAVRIEASTNLVDWQPVIGFAAFSGSIEFLDSSATNLARRFYRAVVP